MTTKLLFDITLTIIIIYIFFIYNVENFVDTSETYKEIKDVVKKIYNEDVESIRKLSEVAKKLHTNSSSLTIPGQLIVDNTTGQTGEIIYTDSFANGNITIGSNNALIKQNGDISGNNLSLKGNISNIGNITVTKGTITGNQIQLKNTLKKDNWIISNIKSNNDTINNNNKLSFMRMNEDIEKGTALDLYDDGNVKIPGNLKVDTLTVDKILIKRNKARYIRVGNMQSTDLNKLVGEKNEVNTSELAVNDYWSLIEIKIFDHKGINITTTTTGIGVTGIEGGAYTNTITTGAGIYKSSKDIYLPSENKPQNIINGRIYSDSRKPSDNLSTTNILGYHGGKGPQQLEIDLVNEYDISYIELYNRFSVISDNKIMIDGEKKSKSDYTSNNNYDGIPGVGIDETSRMNGTIVELISSIPPGKTLDDRIINRSIHTGIWTRIYVKQYIL